LLFKIPFSIGIRNSSGWQDEKLKKIKIKSLTKGVFSDINGLSDAPGKDRSFFERKGQKTVGHICNYVEDARATEGQIFGSSVFLLSISSF
jgi:hypothetical protein